MVEDRLTVLRRELETAQAEELAEAAIIAAANQRRLQATSRVRKLSRTIFNMEQGRAQAAYMQQASSRPAIQPTTPGHQPRSLI